MFEIRESEVCGGYGVFAVKDIPLGTLILREKPLLGKDIITSLVFFLLIIPHFTLFDLRRDKEKRSRKGSK